jgi:magnesium chelatase subunit I
VALTLIGRAVRALFDQYFPDPSDKKEGRPEYKEVLDWFAQGRSIDVDQDMSDEAYAQTLGQIDGLQALVEEYLSPDVPGETRAGMEFVVEALHQHSLIGKEVGAGGQTYDDIMGSMLSSIGDGGMPGDDFDEGDFDDDDDEDRDDPLSRYR